MRRDVLEVRQPVRIARETVAIVFDLYVVFTVLATTRDDNGPGVRIDTVLDQLGDGFERTTLRERDNTDRVPIIAEDRKSTRLNSSHRCISYAVFCLKKKKK